MTGAAIVLGVAVVLLGLGILVGRLLRRVRERNTLRCPVCSSDNLGVARHAGRSHIVCGACTAVIR